MNWCRPGCDHDFAIRSRYSWQEGAQREFNSWLVPRYQDCWRARRAQIS